MNLVKGTYEMKQELSLIYLNQITYIYFGYYACYGGRQSLYKIIGVLNDFIYGTASS